MKCAVCGKEVTSTFEIHVQDVDDDTGEVKRSATLAPAHPVCRACLNARVRNASVWGKRVFTKVSKVKPVAHYCVTDDDWKAVLNFHYAQLDLSPLVGQPLGTETK